MTAECDMEEALENADLSHVLLVDDDPALLVALSTTLEMHLGHFTLETCQTGARALQCISVMPYDLILTDFEYARNEWARDMA